MSDPKPQPQPIIHELDITINFPLTYSQMEDLLDSVGIGRFQPTIRHTFSEESSVISGRFLIPSTQVGRSEFAINDAGAALQQAVLKFYGRFLVSITGTCHPVIPVRFENDWIILTDDQRRARSQAQAVEQQAKREAALKEFVDFWVPWLKEQGVAFVEWGIYWENDEDQNDGVTFLNIDENQISDTTDERKDVPVRLCFGEGEELLTLGWDSYDAEQGDAKFYDSTGMFRLDLATMKLSRMGDYNHDYNPY